MASPGGYQNIILPNQYPSPGEVMDKWIGRNQQESQFERELAERREERDYQRQQQNRLYNLREIDSDTDVSKYKTGQQAIDDYTIGELKKIKDNALQKYINLDPAEMEYRLTQDMNGLISWHQSINDDYKKMQAGLQQFAKDNPNIDINKANDFTMDALGKKYMAATRNGYERLPTEKINFSSNPLDVLNNPSVLGFLTNDVKPFQDYIQSVKTQPIGANEYKSNKGYVKQYKYSGGVTPFSEMVTDNEGKPVGVRVKSEDIDLGGGKKLQMLPEQDFQTMMNIPPVRNALIKMWEDEKRNKGIAGLDKPTDERLMRDFARKQVERFDVSNFKTEDKDVIPKPPSIYLNIGQQAVNDVYKTIDSKIDTDIKHGYGATRVNDLNADAQNIVIDFVKKTTGSDEYNYSNIFLHKTENGDIGIYKIAEDESGNRIAKVTPETLIGYLPQVGTNLKVQPGAPEKREVIKQGNTHTQTQSTQKKKIANF